jgi:membrane protein required for colicin V production
MTALDWFIAGIVLLSSLIGYIRGFLRETIALVAWVLGLWLAWQYAPQVQPYLGGLLADSAMQVWVARIIILFAVLLAGALIGFILAYFVRHSPFGVLDRTFGVVFGLARALVVIGLVIMGGQLLEMQSEPWWRESALMPAAQFLAEWIRHLVNDVTI